MVIARQRDFFAARGQEVEWKTFDYDEPRDLGALLEAAPDDRLPNLRDATLLVPGERVAASARSLGWRGPLVVAPSAEDGVMLATLARQSGRAGPSGGA
jgi:uncharacterized caspase-like protein